MHRLLPGLLLAVTLCACEGQSARVPVHELSGQTMGTTFSVKLVAPDDKLDKDELGRKIDAALELANKRMSTYRDGSELSTFNSSRSADWFKVSSELCETINSALEISKRTNGAFDVTIGPLVNLWGFGPGDQTSEPPHEDAIMAARDRVGFEHLGTDCQIPALRKDQPDIYVDLSAFAKGYAVDQIAHLLDELRLTSYLVEIGGELRMRGHNANGEHWAIAVEKPVDDARTVQAVVHLTDGAMATSGDYRNFFEFEGQRYSHTIDPKTGRPVAHDAASVTVIGESAALADALATALLVLGPEDGLAFAEREGITAYFLLRGETGIEERMTGTFTGFLK